MSAVFQAFNQDLARFINQVKSSKEKENLKSVLKLNDIWDTYHKKVAQNYFIGKLIEIGDFLASQKWYKRSANDCYKKLLCLLIPDIDNENEVFGHSFVKGIDRINNAENLVLGLRGMLGYATSICHNLLLEDPLLQEPGTRETISKELKCVQIIMKKSMERDSLCWILYNSTIHMFSICTKLISNGFAKVALENLLWCCMCIESSVALMTIKYLKWRVKLYASVCQCYYQMNADQQAEAFAKRGLAKVAELQEIEKISTSIQTAASVCAFKQSTILMNVYVFKRSVVESRRRPKGVLRPKVKPLLKDIVNNAWPRTGTERLLSELFHGRAAQFLAIVEALSTPNSRTVQTNNVGENDEHLQEVNLELFFAGVGIISSLGNSKTDSPSISMDFIETGPLLELGTNQSNSISLLSLIKFMKLAFNHENWDTFDVLIYQVIDVVEQFKNINRYHQDGKFLRLLLLLSSVKTSKVKKKLVSLKVEEKGGESVTLQKNYKAAFVDEVLSVALLLDEYLQKSDAELFVAGNHNSLIDIVIMLWTKCKNHFSKITNDTLDSHKAVYQDHLLIKWLKIMFLVQRSMNKVNIHLVDLVAFGEASLKLMMVIQCIFNNAKSVKVVDNHDDPSRGVSNLLVSVLQEICEFMKIERTEYSISKYLLHLMKDSLVHIEKSRDIIIEKYFTTDECLVDGPKSQLDYNQLQIRAFHLEIFYQYHLLQAKFQKLKIGSVVNKSLSKISSKNQQSQQNLSVPQEILDESGQNQFCKAISLMCYTEVNNMSADDVKDRLEEVYMLFEKSAQADDILRNNIFKKQLPHQNIPPPPILVHRGASFMIFKPASFKTKERVYCITLYVRNATGNNVKVRLSDTTLKGTGEMVYFSSNCLLKVEGLKPNEKYVAAIAAYTKDGNLIGNMIGATSRPILATQPLPLADAYCLLAKIAYKKHEFSIAKKAGKKLSNFYIIKDMKTDTDIKVADDDYKLTNLVLIEDHLQQSSLTQYQNLVEVIFIMVSIDIKEEELYCDFPCGKGPLLKSQMKRLELCEMLLVALKVCQYLNDSASMLQACILIYGLVAPIMYWKISVEPLQQILLHLLLTLKEVHIVFKKWKECSPTLDSLQHMIICISAYVAQSFLSHGKRTNALNVLEIGNKLLKGVNSPNSASTTINTEENSTLAKTRHKKSKKRKGGHGVGKNIGDAVATGNWFDGHILEILAAKISQEGSSTDISDMELFGNEDVAVMQSTVTSMPPQTAFKEVLKFKRRTQFMQGVATVVSKGYKERLYDQIFEWTKESFSWVSRRNELVLSKTQQPVTKGIVYIQQGNIDDDKLKKYSTGVVEYTNAPAIAEKTNVGDQLAVSLNLQSAKSAKSQSSDVESKSNKNKTLPVEKKVVSHAKKLSFITSEEKKMKDAMIKMQAYLPDVWKSMQQRKRIRNIMVEEMPWRSQINMTNGECYFNMAVDKLNLFSKRVGYTNLHFDESYLDISQFTLSNTGTIIVSWAGCMKETTVYARDKTVDLGGKTIIHTSDDSKHIKTHERQENVKSITKQGDLKSTNANMLSTKLDDAKKSFILNLELALKHFQKALVLSHRAQCWVLLQQIANKLHTSIHLLAMKIILLNSKLDTTHFNHPYDLPKLCDIIWKPLNLAAEFLLDFLFMYKDTIKKKHTACTFSKDIYEKLSDKSYKFSSFNGYCSGVDFWNIKNTILFAIQTSYYKEKWEHAISLITKFNDVSENEYSEALSPLLIVCQRFLKTRLDEIEKNEKLNLNKSRNVNIRLPLQLPQISEKNRISIGAHIDPEGHNLYDGKLDGQKMCSVPSDWNQSLRQFSSAIDAKPHAIRMLEHSRKLLLTYLAGKYSDVETEGKLLHGTAQVSFVASQVKPLLCDPPNLSTLSFETAEEVETIPAMRDQVPTIVTSYKKSIDMLLAGQLKSFGPYALNELGDVLYHINDLKGAYTCWKQALDGIFQQKNSVNQWRSYVTLEEGSMNRYRKLLDICGVWGCLLGSLLSLKMSRYVLSADMTSSCNLNHLASALIKALLCKSIGHPSTEIGFAIYKIGLTSNMSTLIPGINLFGDKFCVNASVYLANLVWLSAYLIDLGFYVQVQPILTVGQYIAHNVCQSLKVAVEIKTLRVISLSKLHNFQSAIYHLLDIYAGKNLPSPSEVIHTKTNDDLYSWAYDDKQSTQENNINLSKLCKLTILPVHQLLYGKILSQKIQLAFSCVLIELASLITALPEEIPTKGVEVTVETSEIDMLHKKRKSGKKINDQENAYFMPDASDANLKFYLLKSAEYVITSLKNNISTDSNEGTNHPVSVLTEEKALRIESSKQMANICAQHQCLISAYTHVLSSMQIIRDTLTVDYDKKFERKLNKEADEVTNGMNSEKICDPTKWLSLRIMACHYLYYEDNIICNTSTRSGYDFSSIASQTSAECKNLSEQQHRLQVEFLQLKLSLSKGENLQKIFHKLKQLSTSISKMKELSHSLKSLQYEVLLLTADLTCLRSNDYENVIKMYTEIETLLLDQLLFHGYNIDTRMRYPVSCNVNEEVSKKLVTVKTRLHRLKALQMSSNSSTMDKWKQLMVEIDKTIEFRETLTMKDTHDGLELLSIKGEISRLLHEFGECNPSECVNTLLDAINISWNFTRNYGMLRRFFMEIASTLMTASKRKMITKSNVSLELDTGSPKHSRRASIQTTAKLNKIESVEKSSSREVQNLNKAAWLCVRTAAILARLERQIELLSGDISSLSELLTEDMLSEMPKCLVEDLKLFNDTKWCNLLDYLIQTKRSCTYSGFAISGCQLVNNFAPVDCHGWSLKLSQVISYLSQHLPVYRKDCTIDLPIDVIKTVMNECFGKNDKSSVTNLPEPVPIRSSKSEKGGSPKPVNPDKVNDRSCIRDPSSAGEHEAAIQWYYPQIRRFSNDNAIGILALNTKPTSANAPMSQFSLSINVHDVQCPIQACKELYTSMKEFVQIADATQAAQGYPSRSAVVFTAVTAMQNVSRSPVQNRKKTCPIIKPPAHLKQDKEESNINTSKLLSFVEQFEDMLGGDRSRNSEQVFDGNNWSNVVSFLDMLNPSTGTISRVGENFHLWCQQVFSKNQSSKVTRDVLVIAHEMKEEIAE